MLWKCYSQYASKFGKLSSGHWTGKGQFSFQSQRKAMPSSLNIQTTAQLHSSHRLPKECSQFSKLGLNSMKTESFQMFKLDLEEAEEPHIKLPTSTRWEKSKRIQEKHLFVLHDYAKAFDCVDHNKLWKIRDGNTRLPELPPEKSVCRSRSNS